MNRRKFLTCTGAAAALAAAHGFGSPTPSRRPGRRAPSFEGPENPRILGLDLVTSSPLDELETFYGDLLGLKVVEKVKDRLRIRAGRTDLTFRIHQGLEPPPTYHFAFNIPENKIMQARAWQLERTPLLLRPRDAYSHAEFEDVTDFWHWNAHSVFFEDPAGNLLEYIARHDLKNSSPGPFSSTDILYASEIGFTADQVPELGEELLRGTGLDLYYAGGDRFRAIGDPNGLLLVLQGGVAGWSGRGPWTVNQTSVDLRGEKTGNFRVVGHPYEIRLRSD